MLALALALAHLTCPLPPHQLVIWLAHCHHISQSFDLPSTTASLHYYVSQSFYLPPATTSVSHLTWPLPPHQSVIWLALYHHVTELLYRSVIWLAPATTSVSHLTCPLPPHQSVIWLVHCHHIIFPLLGGLSLHLNHLIGSRMTNYDWPFGTLSFGLFGSNFDARDLQTYPRNYSGHFENMSIFDDSRAVWVLFRKWVVSENQFSWWRSDHYPPLSV